MVAIKKHREWKIHAWLIGGRWFTCHCSTGQNSKQNLCIQFGKMIVKYWLLSDLYIPWQNLSSQVGQSQKSIWVAIKAVCNFRKPVALNGVPQHTGVTIAMLKKTQDFCDLMLKLSDLYLLTFLYELHHDLSYTAIFSVAFAHSLLTVRFVAFGRCSWQNS